MKLNDPELFRQKCLVNGEWRDSSSGRVIEVNNPATGEVIGTIPSLNVDEIREAIDAAL